MRYLDFLKILEEKKNGSLMKNPIVKIYVGCKMVDINRIKLNFDPDELIIIDGSDNLEDEE